MERRGGTAWFSAKRYGYGAGLPVAWQGWLALALFIALMAVAGVALRGLALVLAWGVLVAGFVLIAAFKTDAPWRWRWGEDR